MYIGVQCAIQKLKKCACGILGCNLAAILSLGVFAPVIAYVMYVCVVVFFNPHGSLKVDF